MIAIEPRNRLQFVDCATGINTIEFKRFRKCPERSDNGELSVNRSQAGLVNALNEVGLVDLLITKTPQLVVYRERVAHDLVVDLTHLTLSDSRQVDRQQDWH